MSAYPNGNEYCDIWQLAQTRYRGVKMMVSVQRGSIILETIDTVTYKPMSPYGFRRFEESVFPAPIFAPSNVERDMELARDWLELNKAHIAAAELPVKEDSA